MVEKILVVDDEPEIADLVFPDLRNYFILTMKKPSFIKKIMM